MKKSDKYLTEMKELPPSYSQVGLKKKKLDEKTVITKPVYKSDSINVIREKGDIKSAAEFLSHDKGKEKDSNLMKMASGEGNIGIFEDTEKAGDYKRPYTYKDVILGIVNIISLSLFILMVVNFPRKSQELKSLKIQKIRNEIANGLSTVGIENAKPKQEFLSGLFLDEAGVVNFINEVELQKSEGGTISKVSFASQKAVVDKTGNYGIPIMIELKGSWEKIDADLQKIDKLAYLFRPVRVEVGYDETNSQVVVYKYGIILYVKEELGKNR